MAHWVTLDNGVHVDLDGNSELANKVKSNFNHNQAIANHGKGAEAILKAQGEQGYKEWQYSRGKQGIDEWLERENLKSSWSDIKKRDKQLGQLEKKGGNVTEARHDLSSRISEQNKKVNDFYKKYGYQP